MNLFKPSGGKILTKGVDNIEASLREANEWVVEGKYTSSTVDVYGHLILQSGMEKALDEYRQWGTVREMHERPIGTIKSIGTPSWDDIQARVARTDHGMEVMRLVNDGVYKAFSIGAMVTKYSLIEAKQINENLFQNLTQDLVNFILNDIGYVVVIEDLYLIENSIVDRPANPLARMNKLAGAGVEFDGIVPAITTKGGIDIAKSYIAKQFSGFTSAEADKVEATGEIEVNTEENVLENEVTPADEVVETENQTTPEAHEAEVVEKTETEVAVDEAPVSEVEKNVSSVENLELTIETIVRRILSRINEETAVKDVVAEDSADTNATIKDVAESPADEIVTEVQNSAQSDSNQNEVLERILTQFGNFEKTLKDIAEKVNKVASNESEVAERMMEVSVDQEQEPEPRTQMRITRRIANTIVGVK